MPKIFAIGDVHGQHVLMNLAIQFIEDNSDRDDHVIFLGDYIDRGPDSADCLSDVAYFSDRENWTFLRGNHEEMFLNSFESPKEHLLWLENGGEETLKSMRFHGDYSIEDFKDIVEQHTLPSFVKLGRYIFVHAGVKPGVALQDQSEKDLMWIREEFLSFPEDHPLLPDADNLIIVHGHTIYKDPFVRMNAIGIDTGAVYSGNLTVLKIDLETDCKDYIAVSSSYYVP